MNDFNLNEDLIIMYNIKLAIYVVLFNYSSGTLIHIQNFIPLKFSYLTFIYLFAFYFFYIKKWNFNNVLVSLA